MKFWIVLLYAICACSNVELSHNKINSESSLEVTNWPPISFSEAKKIAAPLSVDDVIIVRAAIFLSNANTPANCVVTPIINDQRLSLAEIPLSYPEFDHIFLEWIIQIKEVGIEGKAITYGTVTATDVNQGTTIRGSFQEIKLDTTVDNSVLVALGVVGSGSLSAELLSLTVQQ